MAEVAVNTMIEDNSIECEDSKILNTHQDFNVATNVVIALQNPVVNKELSANSGHTESGTTTSPPSKDDDSTKDDSVAYSIRSEEVTVVENIDTTVPKIVNFTDVSDDGECDSLKYFGEICSSNKHERFPCYGSFTLPEPRPRPRQRPRPRPMNWVQNPMASVTVSATVSATVSVSVQCVHLHTILYNPFFIGLGLGLGLGQWEWAITLYPAYYEYLSVASKFLSEAHTSDWHQCSVTTNFADSEQLFCCSDWEFLIDHLGHFLLEYFVIFVHKGQRQSKDLFINFEKVSILWRFYFSEKRHANACVLK